MFTHLYIGQGATKQFTGGLYLMGIIGKTIKITIMITQNKYLMVFILFNCGSCF